MNKVLFSREAAAMEPQPNTTTAGAVPRPSKHKKTGRSMLTNRPGYLPRQPLSPFARARRHRDLVATFLAAIGPSEVNDLTQVMVRRAAELTLAAEMARASMLIGNHTDILALVRLENTAKRATAALGIKIEPAAPKTPRALQHARARWEAQEAQEKVKAAQAAHREATAKNTEAPDDRAAK
jgi:hypothetical protein